MDGEGFWTLLFKDNVYLKVLNDVMERYPILRRMAEMTQNSADKLINLTEYSITRADIMDYIHNYANMHNAIHLYSNGAQRVMALFGSIKDTREQTRKTAVKTMQTYGERIFECINDPMGLFENIVYSEGDNDTVLIGTKNGNHIYGICWTDEQDIINMKQRFLQYCGCEHDPTIMEGIFIPYYMNLTF